ncbi:MAG: helix-turn-helix transcriptional regulator [Acidobacteriota bacterium]|nr:helix-turn-helix transcriptional regulator [Acidobacteriota bacterium]
MAEIWQEDLDRELQDPEFAKLYGAEQAKGEIAISLAKARINQGLTQNGLAIKVGASQPYIAKLERGDANPTIGNIGSMLAILGLRLVVDTMPLVPQLVEPAKLVGHIQARSSVVQTADAIAQKAWGSYDVIRSSSKIDAVGSESETSAASGWTSPPVATGFSAVESAC